MHHTTLHTRADVNMVNGVRALFIFETVEMPFYYYACERFIIEALHL